MSEKTQNLLTLPEIPLPKPSAVLRLKESGEFGFWSNLGEAANITRNWSISYKMLAESSPDAPVYQLFISSGVGAIAESLVRISTSAVYEIGISKLFKLAKIAVGETVGSSMESLFITTSNEIGLGESTYRYIHKNGIETNELLSDTIQGGFDSLFELNKNTQNSNIPDPSSQVLVVESTNSSGTPSSITAIKTENILGKDEISISSSNYSKGDLLNSSKELIKPQDSGSTVVIDGEDGKINATLLDDLVAKEINKILKTDLDSDSRFKIDISDDKTLVENGKDVVLKDGTVSSLDKIINGIDTAKNTVSNFMNSFVKEATSLFSTPEGVAGMISDISSGIQRGDSAEDIAKIIATKAAVRTLANELQNKIFFSASDQQLLNSGDLTNLSTEGQESLTMLQSNPYYQTAFTAAIAFTTSVLLNANEGWDSEQYTQAAVQSVAQASAQLAVVAYFGSSAVASGVGAGVAHLVSASINDIFADDHMNSHQWQSTVNTAGVLGAAAYVGSAIGAGIASAAGAAAMGSFAGPIGAVVAVIIVTQFMGGKEFKDGEYPDPYSFLSVAPKEDGSGNITYVLEEGAVARARDGYDDDIMGGGGNDVLVGANGTNVISGGGGNDHIEGRDSDDQLLGGDGNDLIEAGAGDDIVMGGKGSDIIYGMDGNDTIDAGDGNDIVISGSGNDIVTGGSGDNFIFGDAGNDQLTADGGDDTLSGGLGDDVVAGGSGRDRLYGGEGADMLLGDAGDDILVAGSSNDTAYGGEGDDMVIGGAGVDMLYGDSGADVMSGGDDSDLILGGLGNDQIGGGSGDDSILGEFGDDAISGGFGNDIIDGGEGVDVISGDAGDDEIEGGAGSDLYIFNLGDGKDEISDESGEYDVLRFVDIDVSDISFTKQDNDLVIGFGGDDQVTLKDSFVDGVLSPAVESLEFSVSGVSGGSSIDLSLVEYNLEENEFTYSVIDQVDEDISVQAVILEDTKGVITALDNFYHDKQGVELGTNETLYDNVDYEFYNEVQWRSYKKARSSFGGHYTVWYKHYEQNIYGTQGVDRLVGNFWDEIIYGQNSGDYLYGNNGSDTIYGYGGDDFLEGGAGNDRLEGGSGNDTLEGASGNDILISGEGDDTIIAGQGDDEIEAGTGNNIIIAESGTNNIFAADGDNQVETGNGDDVVNLGDGDNTIDAGDGNNTLRIGDGDNLIDSGSGDDFIKVGDGDNSIHSAAGSDIIMAGNGQNFVNSGSGNDQITLGNGDNIVYAGTGDDVLNIGSGNNSVYLGYGNDELTIGAGDNKIFSDAGDNVINILSISESISSSSAEDYYNIVNTQDGDDRINIEKGISEINSGAGSDNITISTGDHTINAGSGDNYIATGTGNQVITAKDGDNILEVATLNSTISLGDGDNFLNLGKEISELDLDYYYANYAEFIPDYSLGREENAKRHFEEVGKYNNFNPTRSFNSHVYLNSLSQAGIILEENQTAFDHYVAHGWKMKLEINDGSEDHEYQNNVSLGNGDNIFYGDSYVDNLVIGDGNNSIITRAGNDDLEIGNGDNEIDTGIGSDSVSAGDGNNNINLGSGNNVLSAGNGDNQIVSGQGSDNITLGSGNNIIFSGAGDDEINLGNGDNIITAGEGDDIINSGSGNDTYHYNLGDGSDIINETGGIDELVFNDLNATDIEFEKSGNDLVLRVKSNNQAVTISNFFTSSNSTIETLTFSDGYQINLGDIFVGTNSQDEYEGNEEDEQVLLLGGNDIVFGHGGDDYLEGDDGNDLMFAGSGNDVLEGGAGDDYLDAGQGDDNLVSGSGNDRLFGGSGNDKFVITKSTGSHDVITDFNVEDDTLSLEEFGEEFVDLESLINLKGYETNFKGDVVLNLGNSQRLTLTDIKPENINNLQIQFTDNDNISLATVAEDEFILKESDDILRVIENFDILQDSLKLEDFSELRIEDLKIEQKGSGSLISFDNGHKLLLRGVSAEELSDNNFKFAKFNGIGSHQRYSGSATVEQSNLIEGENLSHDIDYFMPEELEAGYSSSNFDANNFHNSSNIHNSGVDNILYDITHRYHNWQGGFYGANNDGLNTKRVGSSHDTIFLGWYYDTDVHPMYNKDIHHNNRHHSLKYAGGRGRDWDSPAYYLFRNFVGNEDVMHGGAWAEKIYGYGGHDRIFGNNGNDIIWAGRDNDDVNGGNHNDVIYGEDGHDYLKGDEGHDRLYGGNGNDRMYGNNGDDKLYGGNNDDFLVGGNGSDLIYGQNNNDRLYGESGNDSLHGGEGSDYLVGGSGNDYLNGNNGDDTLYGGDGHDTLLGGNGNDYLQGGDGNDELSGESGNDILGGGEGNDILHGNDGSDVVYGGEGSDHLYGDSGDDYLDGGYGADMIYGGDGNDYIVGSSDGANDFLSGGAGNDKIVTTHGNNLIDGGSGADEILAGQGSDTIHGNSGEDYILGGAGSDLIYGGTDNDVILGESGNDHIVAGQGDDYLEGGEDDDLLEGGQGLDTLIGGLHHDYLDGGDGDDYLQGDQGNDQLYGGSGNDILDGGEGSDSLSGGAGDDIYYYSNNSGKEVILEDESQGNDTIKFMDNINLPDLSLVKDGSDLKIIIFGDEANSVVVENQFLNDQVRIESLEFADGTALGLSSVGSELSNITITNQEGNINIEAAQLGSFFSMNEDDKINIPLAEGSTLLSSASSAGIAEVVDGNLIFSPTENFNGLADLNFSISDESGEIKEYGFKVAINPVNDAPIVNIIEASTNEDELLEIDILANSSDVEGDNISLIAQSAQNGKVELSDSNTLIYTPNSNYYGNDTITYVVIDDKGARSTKTLEIIVNNVGDIPVVVDNLTVNTAEDKTITIDPIAHSFDADGDDLTITEISTSPENGVAVIIDNKIIYTPNENYNGTDIISYVISDGENYLTKNITLEISPENDAPVIVNSEVEVQEDGSVIVDIFRDLVDIDGDELSLESISKPRYGAAQVIDGKIIYVPKENYNGSDSIIYTISDGVNIVTNELIFKVNSVNDLPVVETVSRGLNEDNILQIDPLKYTYDVDGDNLELISVGGAEHGLASIINNKILYLPHENYNGTDSLEFTIFDGTDEITQTITIDVAAINDSPEVGDDAINVLEDQETILDILSNDYDVEGEEIRRENVTLGAALNGVVSFNESGQIVYRANENYSGTDKFTYTIKDDAGLVSNVATVELMVLNVNDAPTLLNQISDQMVRANQEQIIRLGHNMFKDIDADNLNISVNMSDGSDLPDWISYDSTAKTITVNASADETGAIDLKITANDGEYRVFQEFTLVVKEELQVRNDERINLLEGGDEDDLVIAQTGDIDLIFAGGGDDDIVYNIDDIWGAGYNAQNSYTGEKVSVEGKIRSFDAFDGGEGDGDTLYLTEGDDSIFLHDLISDNPTISGSRLFGIETINALSGDDIIDLSSNIFTYGSVTINGSEGDDVLWSNDGNDVINGAKGSDNIISGRGNDTLNGGEGDDYLHGYDGDDILTGGSGRDVLIGGQGSDIFRFSDLIDSTTQETDIIKDFELGIDLIDIADVSFEDLKISNDSNNTFVSHSDSDFMIELEGIIDLDQNDFMAVL